MRAAVRALKNEILDAEADLAKVVDGLYFQFGDTFSVDIGADESAIRLPGTDLLYPPAPGAMGSGGLDENNDGVVSQDELVVGIEAPTTDYVPPNAADSY